MRVVILTTDSREHYKDYRNPQPYFGAAPEALLQGFEQLRDMEVHVISCLQEAVHSPEKIAPNISYHGLHVPKIGWLRTGYQGCVRAVRKCVQKLQPDIVHGQGTERDCSLCAVLSGFPNVVTIHGNIAQLSRSQGDRIGSYGWFSARIEDFTLRRTGGVFCNSNYTEQLVKGRTRRVWRVPNPLREAFFSTGPVPTQNPKPVILNVGVIRPLKRQVELLELAKRLHEQGLLFEFRFVGHVPQENSYARAFLREIDFAAKAGYASYRGMIGLDGIIRCFDESDVLVHFPTEEAFGLVVAEGLARNLRVFASRTGGIIDIAGNLPEASLYDIDDWEGLAGALESWLRERPAKGDSAGTMRDRYAPEVIARRHLEIYHQVMSSPSQKRRVA